jgi:hypothetical protein
MEFDMAEMNDYSKAGKRQRIANIVRIYTSLARTIEYSESVV